MSVVWSGVKGFILWGAASLAAVGWLHRGAHWPVWALFALYPAFHAIWALSLRGRAAGGVDVGRGPGAFACSVFCGGVWTGVAFGTYWGVFWLCLVPMAVGAAFLPFALDFAAGPGRAGPAGGENSHRFSYTAPCVPGAPPDVEPGAGAWLRGRLRTLAEAEAGPPPPGGGERYRDRAPWGDGRGTGGGTGGDR